MYKSNNWESGVLPPGNMEKSELSAAGGKDALATDKHTPAVEMRRITTAQSDESHLHSHPFFELICCRQAMGAEYLVGVKRYKLQKGDIVFIPPGISHRCILDAHDPTPFTRDLLWISEELFVRVLAQYPDLLPEGQSGPLFLRTAGTRWEYMAELFHFGVQEAEAAQRNWQLASISQGLSILTHLSRACYDPNAQPMQAEKPELLDQVLTYIEQHLSEKITLSEIARHFFVSESTITQNFRRKMGVSFYRCVTQRRLIAAKGLIERGVPLEAVAEQVGFSDYSSFFRAFKQEYAMSPRQYRKIHTASESK